MRFSESYSVTVYKSLWLFDDKKLHHIYGKNWHHHPYIRYYFHM